MRWAAPEILDRERPISKESNIRWFSAVVIEVSARSLLVVVPAFVDRFPGSRVTNNMPTGHQYLLGKICGKDAPRIVAPEVGVCGLG